nr:MAG TPA: hypothetical protein [Caudoviricetes sp.]
MLADGVLSPAREDHLQAILFYKRIYTHYL